jgi:L-seryl-tRNA(Ser) seleniumtransferase
MDVADLRNLPSVDSLLKRDSTSGLISMFGRDVVVYAIREVVADFRSRICKGEVVAFEENIDKEIGMRLSAIRAEGALRQIVNATGIVLHTNLGRAVLGKTVLNDITSVITGYSCIEFDCSVASRGNRNAHLAPLLRYLTGAEEVLVVNNNAAGIILCLSTLAKDREVIISRGELIEIGGEFRIPDIMTASGARMVEVGTTNRTRLKDYEAAITDNTACIFKAHKSNYSMRGFVEEASIKELAHLARSRGIVLLYDMGSGLLRKPAGLPLDKEPDVASSITEGADAVLFSGDKLLGGPQAGIIAGKKDLLAKCGRAPLMRALRVGKLTLAALASACRLYLDDKRLLSENPVFFMLSRQPEDILRCAERLRDNLRLRCVASSIVEVEGQCGGGALPDVQLQSFAVKLDSSGTTREEQSKFSEKIFKRLLSLDRPVLGILREGELFFDMRTIDKTDIDYVAAAIQEIVAGKQNEK